MAGAGVDGYYFATYSIAFQPITFFTPTFSMGIVINGATQNTSIQSGTTLNPSNITTTASVQVIVKIVAGNTIGLRFFTTGGDMRTVSYSLAGTNSSSSILTLVKIAGI